jgi:hypothetical protein
MKHIKLFEAFESNILSKTLGYLDKESKKLFMDRISKFCTKIDFPKSKLSDDFFEYLPFNSALKKVISAEDKIEDCKSKSEEVFGDKGIKDDVCTKGKLKRIWGAGKRDVDCPKCLGTGKIKVGESDAPEGYELIKFWVNDKKDIVNITVTDGKSAKVASNSGYVGYGKIYKGSYYPGRRDNIDDIPHLSKVLIQWRENDPDWLGTIYHSNSGTTYVIHNNNRKDGSDPGGREWRNYGRYGWDLSDMDVYKIQMCKEKEPDDEINYYLYNKLADSDLNSSSTPSSTGSLDGSQFAIVFDTGKLKKSEYTKRTEIVSGRRTEIKGLVGGKLGLSNDAIKKQNLDKYIKALATKDIKGDVSDLTSLDNYIFRILGGKNLIFKMLNGETGDVVKVIEGFFKMLKVNEGYNNPYDDDQWYRDEVVKFMNSPKGEKFRNNINDEYRDLNSSRGGMSEYDVLVYLYNKYVKELSVDNVDGDKTTGIKNTLLTLFEKSIKENQRISNEVKTFLSNPKISAFDKQTLRSVLSVSELIYDKLKSFGKIENLMDAELVLQKIKTINDVITNSRWDFYHFIKGKKDVYDFKSGTRTKEGADKFVGKLSTSVEEIKNLINKI